MKLIKNLIEKEIELYNDLMLNRKYLRAISLFYCAFNLAVSVLNLNDIDVNRRNKFWVYCLLNYEEIDDRILKIIHNFLQEDIQVIIKALNFIDKENENMTYEMGDIYKPFCVGILSYELES